RALRRQGAPACERTDVGRRELRVRDRVTADRRAGVSRAGGTGAAVKAYEQVAGVLHGRVVAGELEPGSRLPTEAMLATEFGVSRATVREALRQLDAQSLIRTSKGATGGS